MQKNYDGIEKVLGIETSIASNEPESIETLRVIESIDDPRKDYEFTRSNLYTLIEKGQQAIDGILELATESEQPRAFEVAGQLIKSVGDVTDKLLDLQKKMKDLDSPTKKGNTTVNNALFVGSTAELSKFLKQGILNNTEDEI